jgi:hypothetical protein
VGHTPPSTAETKEVGWRGDPAHIVIAALERTESVAHLLPDWTQHAACHNARFDFVDGRHQTEALQVCGRCPVLGPCREWAIANPSLDQGVLGGMTATARRAARTARRQEIR